MIIYDNDLAAHNWLRKPGIGLFVGYEYEWSTWQMGYTS